MNVTWQDVVAVGIVMVALAYLARTVITMLRGRSTGCGTCGSCGADEAKTPPLVSLDGLGKPLPSTTPGPKK